MSTQRHPVGIDLGTTFSSLSYVDGENRVQTVRLPDGELTLASAVYFRGPGEIVVGSEALQYAVIEPDRVARAFKRHMGEPGYAFRCDGRDHHPEELSAMVLKKLAAVAAEQVGPVGEVVISVPFVFDEARRRATLDAARIAGLSVLDLVDEPVAAALAFGHTLLQGEGLFGHAELNELFGDALILVYDLGGGTFDATVMRLGGDGTFEVLATDGDERLGGEDWDDVLLRMLLEDHRKRWHEDLREDRGLLQELRLKVVEAKKALSARSRVEVEYAHRGKPYRFAFTRGDFERETAALLARTQATAEEMLARKGMGWGHIDRILMVGGASRMPMVYKMLERAARRRLDMSLPPDVAISSGAALYAALRAGGREMRVKEVRTVNSHPLGLKVIEKATRRVVNDVLLKANEPTFKKVGRAYRVAHGREGITLSILLGDSPDPGRCKLLGQGRISGVPAGSGEGDVVRVTFCFLPNGLLQVAAAYHPAAGGAAQQVQFEIDVDGKMSEEEVAVATASLRGITIE